MAVLNLYLAICKDTGGARHWILILAEEGAQNGTWYHVTGGPTQGRSYKLEIQTKRVNSHGIESHHLIGQINDKDKNKLKSSAQKATLRFCQRWAVDVLSDLEKKKLVAAETSNTWANYMENDPYSDDGVVASSSASQEWVWDEQARRYRRWDASSQQWVWQS
ncbi:unnamed protein product [Clonostachys rosea f. rosea IK726]|jgi:hypothetical protein|uniref:Uncharacterized protein n=1 Tax=Clonostachys rosea f. rosea IK726 TaxID=1349383 RepID=A0ACA9TJC4_BIOOC|nr:unnamed protein product [Clonostachys rosea f. rosea IK726]